MSDGKKTFTVTFLDGEKRRVKETTYSRAIARAAWERAQQGADTHRELYVVHGDMPGEQGRNIHIRG